MMGTSRRLLGNLLVLVLVLMVVGADDTDTDTDTVPDTDTTAGLPTTVEVMASIDVPITTTVRTTAPSKDPDTDERCAVWANEGECESNPEFMLKGCAASCGVTIPTIAQKIITGTARVYTGEDAAMGAFRFAEEYSTALKLEDGGAASSGAAAVQTVLDVAQQLQDALATSSSSSSSYTVPNELTHCNDAKSGKQRLCSAGKLWKRAEEMRKADMHDAAGADLVRALSKSGIETDFIERCTRSLQWAFGSISRQREREAREAIEEEKLQVRRQAEAEAVQEALERKQQYEADFAKFGSQVQASVAIGSSNSDTAEDTVDADGTVHTNNNNNAEIAELILNVKRSFVEAGPQGGNWAETLLLTRKIPGGDKSPEILLIEARCHEMLGNHQSALSSAGRLIQTAANYDPWINDSPRMMAATLGANAAMQLGLSANALSFYQTVLKFDPEQSRARKQYRGLKKVVKLMDKADEQIQKGYNKAASVFVDDCLSAMRGLDVDSPLFRSKIQLKQCTILSAMNKHEEALSNCDSAVELRAGNDAVSPASQKEAHLVRGEALLLDMDYDEAVQDFRAALELVPADDQTGEQRELQQKLKQTQHQQGLWNGGQKDHRYNDQTGYPEGRPPERDHSKILELPIDLEQRGKDIKCAWLKKQFKTLVRKFHPDKYKGNKKRAARKFKEVTDAKAIISSAWNC